MKQFKEESKKYRRAPVVQAPIDIICLSDSDEEDSPGSTGRPEGTSQVIGHALHSFAMHCLLLVSCIGLLSRRGLGDLKTFAASNLQSMFQD